VRSRCRRFDAPADVFTNEPENPAFAKGYGGQARWFVATHETAHGLRRLRHTFRRQVEFR
jgi:hypothetical protein